jgi:glycosyltransferase involved in cell wall biosynthesis
MKICIATRFFPQDYVGGGENVIFNIWKNAVQKEYEVKLISGWVKDPALLPKSAYKVDLRSKNRFIRYFKLYRAVKKFVSREKPNVVHTNTMEIPALSVPTIVMVHHVSHFVEIKGSFFERIRLMLQRELVIKRLEKAKYIVAVSNSTKEDLERLGINPSKIRVIHNGIDFERFDRIKKGILDVLKKQKEFVIVYPSRISKEKAQHVAIRAFKELPLEIREKCRLVLPGFVSDRKYLSRLKKHIQGYNIDILENVESIEPYYLAADLVIFPTMLKEGFGLVAAEALACSKPVIASDVPAVREVLGKYGTLVEVGSINKLKDAIIDVYKHRKRYERIAKKGNDYVRKTFSWKKAFEKYDKLYEEIGSKRTDNST